MALEGTLVAKHGPAGRAKCAFGRQGEPYVGRRFFIGVFAIFLEMEGYGKAELIKSGPDQTILTDEREETEEEEAEDRGIKAFA